MLRKVIAGFLSGILLSFLFSSSAFAADGPAGQLTVEADNYSSHLSSRTVQLSCTVNEYAGDGCSASTSNPKILSLTKSAGKSGDDYTITYNTFMTDFFGKIACDIKRVSCTLQAQAQGQPTENLADFQIRNMKTVFDSHYQLYWQADLTNTQSDQKSTLAVTTPSTSGSAIDLALNFHNSTDGALILGTDIPNEPAKLVCENGFSLNATLNKDNKPEFSLSDIYHTASPTGDPTDLTTISNCNIEDAKGLIYASYDSISKLGVHDTKQNPSRWAAEYSTVANGAANYIVSDTPSEPVTDDPNAFTQMQVNFNPIINGELKLNFKQVANEVTDVYVQCGGADALKATNDGAGMYTVQMRDMHGTNNSPLTPVNYSVCTVQNAASSPSKTYATFKVANLKGNYATVAGAQPMWAMELSNITPEYSEYIVNTTPISSSCDYQDGQACNIQAIDFTIRQTPTAGTITLENKVATPPAKLVCDDQTFTATDSGDKETFDIEAMHKQIAAAADPTKLQTVSNCKLEDSAKTPIVYANVSSLSAIGLHDANTQSSLWAATASGFENGLANYLATETSSMPTVDDPQAFNQYAISIQPITSGKIDFTGAVKDLNKLYVKCDGNAPIELTSGELDLRTLHGTATSATHGVDYAQCSLLSDPATLPVKTYATFKITGLKGDYASAQGSQPMWATEVSDIENGNTSLTVNPVPVTTTCDYQDSSKCNQTQIAFSADAPGKIEIYKVPPSSKVVCSTPNVDLLAAGAITPISGGIRIDLQKAHDTQNKDKATDVTLNNCDILFGYTEEGTFTLSNINGIRTPDGKQANMWSVAVTNPDQYVAVTNSSGCDASGNYCNEWELAHK